MSKSGLPELSANRERGTRSHDACRPGERGGSPGLAGRTSGTRCDCLSPTLASWRPPSVRPARAKVLARYLRRGQCLGAVKSAAAWNKMEGSDSAAKIGRGGRRVNGRIEGLPRASNHLLGVPKCLRRPNARSTRPSENAAGAGRVGGGGERLGPYEVGWWCVG